MISPYWSARLTRDLTNLSLVRQPHADAHIISLHQSGTHWLRHMLSVLMARLYNLPEPVYLQDSDFIPSPREESKYPGIPRIVSSHTIASPLLTNRFLLSLFRTPKYVLLVRDPRVILASHYQREKARYKISFSEFLRADLDALRRAGGRRRFDKSIWWDIRFQNSWGRINARLPEKTHLIRYEDLRQDTARHLHGAVLFLGLKEANIDALTYAIAQSSKEAMSQKEAPGMKYKVVRQDSASPLSIYSEEDKRYFLESYKKYCTADFGYDLKDGW